jgi:hypothetical protein
MTEFPRLGCSRARRETAFHDFGAYEQLLDAARSIDWRTYLIALLGVKVVCECARSWRLEWGDIAIE